MNLKIYETKYEHLYEFGLNNFENQNQLSNSIQRMLRQQQESFNFPDLRHNFNTQVLLTNNPEMTKSCTDHLFRYFD